MPGKDDRRTFLKLLLAGSAASLTAVPAQGADGETKVRLLSEDGRLVEVDASVWERFRTGKRARNEEIRDFIHRPGKTDNHG